MISFGEGRLLDLSWWSLYKVYKMSNHYIVHQNLILYCMSMILLKKKMCNIYYASEDSNKSNEQTKTWIYPVNSFLIISVEFWSF